MRKPLLKLAALTAYTYVILLACSTAFHFSPNLLKPLMKQDTWEQLVSLNVLNIRQHPQYRAWLQGFVHDKDAQPRDYHPDTHAFHAVPYEIIPLDDEAVDVHGYKNAIAPAQARVLFTGDSFAVGGGVGSRLAAPAAFSRLTGCPVYNASMGGYGLAHTPRVIRHFLEDLPPGERFQGRDVVILSYLGNDLTLDLDVARARQANQQDRLGYLLKLGPLRRLFFFALPALAPRAANAAAPGYDGFDAVPLTGPTWRSIPFSFHSAVEHFLTLDGFEANIPDIRALLGQVKALEARGARIRIVAIPTGLQVVEQDIDTARLDPASRFARQYRAMAANMNAAQDRFLALCAQAGLETLDARPALLAHPRRTELYYPHDTHMTPLGQEALAGIVAQAFPDIAKACRTGG